MAITETIVAPTWPQTADGKTVFNQKSDALAPQLIDIQDQMNTYATQANALRDEVNGFQQTATAQAVAAANSASESAGYANDSLTSRNEAATIRDQTASIKASIEPGLITNGDDFSVDTNAWSLIKAADECGSLPYRPIFDFNFAKDDYSEYVDLSAGTRHAPLLDLATFTRAGDATGVNLFGRVETVGTNQPRVVFENGVAKGILLEKNGENLIPESESGSGVEVIENPDSGISPRGDLTADFFAANSTNAEHYSDKSISVDSGTTYCFSFFAKQDAINSTFSKIMIRFAGAAVGSRIFDFETETFNSSTGTTIKKVGSYYRISHSITASSTGILICRVQFVDDANSLVFAGDDVSGFYIWGRQLEIGSTPSSYIKTEGLSAIRAADDFSKTLPDEFDSNGDWTLRAEFVPKEVGEGDFNTQFMSLFDSNNSLFRLNVMSNTTGRLYVDIFQGNFVDSVTTSVDLNDEPTIKIKLRKTGDDISVFVNSVNIGALNMDGNNFDVNRINLGRGHNSSLLGNSIFSRAALYPAALPDIYCTALTGV